MILNVINQTHVHTFRDAIVALNDGAVLIQGGLFLDAPAVFDLARKDALTRIAEKHAEMLIAATGGATAAERDTWLLQEKAAHDVLAGGDGGGVLRPKRGETLRELAVKIVGENGNGGKAAAYRQLVGIANEIKRNAEQDVEALTLDSLNDLAALADAKSAADNAFNQLTTGQ